LIKKPSFCTAEGIGIGISLTGTGNDIVEAYGFSLLLAADRGGFIRFRRKGLLCLLLLACGDVESCPGPCRVNSFKEKDFTIVHQNVCGLKGKKDHLEDFLFCNNIKLFGISETLLTHKLPSSFINIWGYVFERRDRNDHGGGVGIYIKQGIQYLRRYDLENDEVEGIWIEFKQSNAKNFIVGIIYRPPDTSKHLSKNFENSFINCIKKITSETKECIILGDININYLNDECHKKFKEMIDLQGLIQMINEPTRVTKDTKTLIDVVLTSHPENLCNINVVLSSLSDHDIISCKRKVNNIKISDITINCRDYKNYDPKQVNNVLATAD
jgi:exonuclease III